jgi:hypothetical protein
LERCVDTIEQRGEFPRGQRCCEWLGHPSGLPSVRVDDARAGGA